MGLDTVEIVMEMEATFGIVFEDLDAEKIGTVGQAYRYILGKLELSRSDTCPSAALFYKLRRTLMTRYGADRRAVRPSSQIGDFLPESDRRAAWIGLGDEVGMTMPRLEFGGGLRSVAWLLAFSPFLLGWAAFCFYIREISWEATGLVIFLGMFCAILTFRLLDPFAKKIPRSCQTIRGTIETTLGRNRLIHPGQDQPWHPNEVWFTLRELIAVQAGVPTELITEEKSFVNDLGMD